MSYVVGFVSFTLHLKLLEIGWTHLDDEKEASCRED
jgi:hypothetical protein